jgi:hypothetical protein
MRALARALQTVQGQGDKAQRIHFFTTLAVLEYIDRGEPLQVARKYEEVPARAKSSHALRSALPAAHAEVA